jgi:hypothetical protein
MSENNDTGSDIETEGQRPSPGELGQQSETSIEQPEAE